VPQAAPQLALPSSGLADDVEWPQTKSKKPLVFAVLGALVVGGAIWAISSSSGETEPPAAATPQAATPEAPAAQNPMDSPRASPAPSPAEPEQASDDEPASDTEGSSPPSGDFADIFKKKVKKDP
jgi:hypothetical protein